MKEEERFKMVQLEEWFILYFDKQLAQSLWQDDFKPSHDKYFDKDYANIEKLKAQANIVRSEIKELRQLESEVQNEH